MLDTITGYPSITTTQPYTVVCGYMALEEKNLRVRVVVVQSSCFLSDIVDSKVTQTCMTVIVCMHATYFVVIKHSQESNMTESCHFEC